MLSLRKKKILSAVVDGYIQKASPVSSKEIQKNCMPDCSSATIRNELSALEEELFGDDRLRDLLNEYRGTRVEELCRMVKAGVDAFAEGEPQFDDMTMLALKYKRVREMKELTLEATIENLGAVTQFVEEHLEEVGCAMKTQMQI